MARGCRLQRATKGELVSLLAVICPQPHIGEDIRVSFVSEWLIVPPHPLHLAPLSLSKKQKKKNKSAKKSASNLATLSQTNRSVACFVAYKSILFHYLKKKKTLTQHRDKVKLNSHWSTCEKSLLAHFEFIQRYFEMYFPPPSRRDDGSSFKAQPNMYCFTQNKRKKTSQCPAPQLVLLVTSGDLAPKPSTV